MSMLIKLKNDTVIYKYEKSLVQCTHTNTTIYIITFTGDNYQLCTC